jgi:hypothetical protein
MAQKEKLVNDPNPREPSARLQKVRQAMFKQHVAAVTRDYIVHPRLGKFFWKHKSYRAEPRNYLFHILN